MSSGFTFIPQEDGNNWMDGGVVYVGVCPETETGCEDISRALAQGDVSYGSPDGVPIVRL